MKKLIFLIIPLALIGCTERQPVVGQENTLQQLITNNPDLKDCKTYYYYMCEHCSRRLNVEKADPIIINNILELDELKILDKANLLMFDLLDGISTLQKDIENLKDEQDKLLDKILNITIENLEIKTKLEKKIEKEIDSLDKIISDKNKKIELLRIQLNNKKIQFSQH